MPIVGSISIEWQENHRLTIEKELMKRVEVQLKKNFEAVGSCELFTEPDVIKEKVIEAAKGLAKPVIESWEHYPEMVGEVSIEKPLPSASKRTVVVEVVSDRPTLREVYRLKRYAEVITPDYAFIISEKPFDEEIELFLRENIHVLKYLIEGTTAFSGSKPIVAMCLEDDTLVRDEDISPADPFDPKHMWT
jgi:hypothetical protein